LQMSSSSWQKMVTMNLIERRQKNLIQIER
jgi:hypothetical protein